MDPSDFWVWFEYGREQGWISEITCYFHDGVPMTAEEVADVEEYGETCIPVARFYSPPHPEDV